MDIEALFCGGDDVLKLEREKSRVGEEKDGFVCFALAKSGSSERDAGKKLFKVDDESGSGEVGMERNGGELGLLARLMAFSVQRNRGRWSWW